MTQREPLFFTIIIKRATNGPNPEKFLGYKEGISCDNNVVKRKDTGGSSSSCSKVHFFYGDRDVMKSNTFKVLVNGKIPFVPKEFMKKGCRQHDVVLKMGGKSWLVKVKSCKFDKGWSQFVKECKIEIGDTCLFELIDDKKFVFQVSIAGKNH
ncbi:B3 domain-containing protein REM9-like [Trifolium pratense]|uniref:B3 domain-containing protein REM9-like n=1 Tax=Trifolium pratense TaxID=57577 RepID=UPI001E69759A|nr:B3 domain-containing protein REM9-like [Trifolium pratense]